MHGSGAVPGFVPCATRHSHSRHTRGFGSTSSGCATLTRGPPSELVANSGFESGADGGLERCGDASIAARSSDAAPSAADGDAVLERACSDLEAEPERTMWFEGPVDSLEPRLARRRYDAGAQHFARGGTEVGSALLLAARHPVNAIPRSTEPVVITLLWNGRSRSEWNR